MQKVEMMIKCKLPQHLLVTEKAEVVVNVVGYGYVENNLPVFRPTSFTFSPVQYLAIIDHDAVYNHCLTTSLDAYKQHLNLMSSRTIAQA